MGMPAHKAGMLFSPRIASILPTPQVASERVEPGRGWARASEGKKGVGSLFDAQLSHQTDR
jgi:hypothetical protein